MTKPQYTNQKEEEFVSFINRLGNSRKDIVIFAPSYHSAKIIIPILKKLQLQRIRVELIVSNPELYKLFVKHYKHLYCYIHDTTIIRNTVRLWNVYSILQEINILHKYKRKVHFKRGANVLYFSLDFADRDFYLLKYLNDGNTNSLFYVKSSALVPTTKVDSFKNTVRQSAYRMLYGNELRYVKYGKKYFNRIGESFVAKSLIVDAYSKNISALIKEKINTIPLDPNIQVLYLDSPFEYSPGFESESVHKIKIKVLEELNKYAGSIESVGVKYHPWHITSRNFLNYGLEIPSYIPAEFISLKNCKTVISIVSLSLSQEFIGDREGICLVYLLHWSNKKIRDEYAQQMYDINPNLHFPKNFSEYSTLLKSLFNNGK
jgi:hypothetical protein